MIFPDQFEGFGLPMQMRGFVLRGGGDVGVVETVAALELLDIPALTRDEVRDGFTAAARVQGFLDATRVRLARRLDGIAEDVPSMFTEDDIANASKSSRSDAAKTAKRAKTLKDVPQLEDVLAAGDVSTEHVDAVGRALRRLKAEHRSALAADGERLALVAARSTPEEFETFLKREVARLDEREGGERLTRQKRAIRFRSWKDKDSGMVVIRCELDPETGLRMLARIDSTADRLFHKNPPADCPEGEDKQDYLRAAALVNLVDRRSSATSAAAEPTEAEPEATNAGPTVGERGEGGSDAEPFDAEPFEAEPFEAETPQAGDPHLDDEIDITVLDNRVEMVVVIDLQTLLNGLHEHSIITNGHNVELPVESYRRMACNAAIIPVVLDGDGVALDEGKSKRLATIKQRLALYAMYDTCGIPGCRVSSRHCQPHHVQWSTRFGDTDLDNLLPVCSRHHHALHEGGWQLVMHHDRSLTITYPDGTIQRTGHPANSDEPDDGGQHETPRVDPTRMSPGSNGPRMRKGRGREDGNPPATDRERRGPDELRSFGRSRRARGAAIRCAGRRSRGR